MPKIATLTLNPAVDKSCAVQQVVADRKLRCSRPRQHPGGGGVNVARAIAELRGEVAAYWTCGGSVGDLLNRLLDEESLEHYPITISGMTRENLVVYESSSERQYRFGMPGPRLTSDDTKTCLDRLQAIDPTPEYLVLSGSLPPGAEDDLYKRIANTMGEACRVVLDTSGKPLQLGVGESVYLIKPNMRELAQLAGRSVEGDSQIREAARSLISNGDVQAVVTSLGSGGAILTTAEEHQHFRAPTVKIRSKVGAGDSMVAGLVLALSEGQSLAKAVQFGVAAGSAAVLTEGTELCRKEDVERLFQEML